MICCCDDGDIEGATRILDQMKSLDMEIDENIYAALITGHCRRGDMESAEGMLEVMRGNGMLPTTTSYTALLCGYADRGDMDRIEQVSSSSSPTFTHSLSPLSHPPPPPPLKPLAAGRDEREESVP